MSFSLTVRKPSADRRTGFAVAATFLVCVFWGGRACGAEPEPVLCALNRLEGALVPGGFLSVIGWAADPAHGAPVAKIEIRLEGGREGEGELAGLRPDVLSHFGRPDYLWAGWSATVSLDGIPPGKHHVGITAVSLTGKRGDCGTHEFRVLSIPEPPEPAAWQSGSMVLAQSLVFLLWLTFAGWGVARLTGRANAVLRAPFLGLALFAIFAEGGSELKLRPVLSAGALTGVAVVLLILSYRRRRPIRGWPVRLADVAPIGFVAAFAAVAVGPFALHGEGAVLGDIDDAIRESTLADAIVLYDWNIPSGGGYLAAMGTQMLGTGGRRGGPYLLAGLAEVFGTRAHAVYSSLMLALGCLVLLGAFLAATRVLRRHSALRWVATFLVAVNSTLLATIYGQHLGNLLSLCLFLAFSYESLRLVRSPRWQTVIPTALLIAGSWTLYTEILPLWAAAAAASLLVAGSSWRKAIGGYVAAVILSAVLNPVGALRTVRFWGTLDDLPGLDSSYGRMIAGDTHYFPSLNVVSGLEAYREDAAAPAGRVRRVAIPLANMLVIGIVVIGWRRLWRRQRAMVVWLLAPVALALLANYRLAFPYGYAKFLPIAAPVWALAFVLLASGVLNSRRSGPGINRPPLFVATALAIVALLCLASARHVYRRAARQIPVYDPAFRTLPRLAEVVGRDAVILVETETPLNAWLLYFLGENQVLPLSVANRDSAVRYFFLEDRRRPDGPGFQRGFPSSRYFALRPAAERATS